MKFISENNLAALVGTSNYTVQRWVANGDYPTHKENGILGFDMHDLSNIPEIEEMLVSKWADEKEVKPLRQYNSIELFAGGGGLALGMSLAGFHHVLLNEFEAFACKTLKTNRPDWNVIEGDVRHIDFTPLRGKVDFISGGFPCQAFSYAGKQAGFNDMRGTLFFELARAVKEIQPLVFMGENVKGLTSHDDGKTFETIKNAIAELGYTLVEPRVLKAIMYQVPQKRERLIMIAIRNDIASKVQFHWPSPYNAVLTLRDALYESVIYDTDVPKSEGVKYPVKKQKVLELVPQGGDWRNLPEDVAKEYMGGSWFLGGGKTGMARRLSLDEPSLTLTCSPCQKQTERCHPLETRPLTVREYARIQTFPDYWKFEGTMTEKYKQIGNAVPVNLAWAVGRSLIRLFNDIQKISPSKTAECTDTVRQIMREQSRLITVKDNKTQTSKVLNKVEQLNLFDLFEQYEYEPIVNNLGVCEDNDPPSNCIVALITQKESKQFEQSNATFFKSGSKFPASVVLQKMHYFAPYIKNKGIRDLYFIKSVYVGRISGKSNSFQLVFEIGFVKKLYTDYVPFELNIWNKYNNTTIKEIIGQ